MTGQRFYPVFTMVKSLSAKAKRDSSVINLIMAKLKPKYLAWKRRFAWEKCFHKSDRIEASLVENHPDYPTHDHEFVELAVIVGGTCMHQSALGEQQVAPG